MESLPFDTVDRPEIPVAIVKKLIKDQFPQWANLEVRPVERSGWDNRTFHLGSQMSVRMPSSERYAQQVDKEHEWLPYLAKHLPVQIPKPVGLGKPSDVYPFNWSIYEWIEGDTSDSINSLNLGSLALELANFLNKLYVIDTSGGPMAGAPFYRGTPPGVYDGETRTALIEVKGIVDEKEALEVWESAMTSEWERKPVWFHGDFSPQNILVKNGQLAAVIDFGSSRVGDPACDLVIAWTLLDSDSREIFRKNVGLDQRTWARARGWAIWKALITLAPIDEKDSDIAKKSLKVIKNIIDDHKLMK